jgi:hypothetical protein
MRIREVITRLYQNPLALSCYVIFYLFVVFAITYLWHVRMVFKVVAIVVWMFFCPDLEDLVTAWRTWRRAPR